MCGGVYRWKINDTEVGSTSDLATALGNCVSQTSGVREVHVLVSGDLSATVELKPGLRLHCYGNTFTRSHGADAWAQNEAPRANKTPRPR